jgi:hypothetical protein
MNPKSIQFLRDTNFVVNAEGNTFGLRAVSQGRIIDHDLLRIHISRNDSVSQRGGVCKSFVIDPPCVSPALACQAGNVNALYRLMVTGVPTFAASKNRLALDSGMRMHPCDAG